MMKNKNKPKCELENAASTSATSLSPEAEQQFEVELCWCIQQLQTGLRQGKLSPKQVQDHTKALNTLMSNSAPLVKKRQVMRLSYGDYRSKMAAESKRFNKLTQQVRLKTEKPNKKSVFVKKSIFSEINGDLKNTFDVSEETKKNPNNKIDKCFENYSNFRFVPSNDDFKFNFSISS